MVFLNQKGSAMILSLLVFTFLAIVIPSMISMTNTQLMSTVGNNDAIEAQYAAEAGIKRAIVGIQNKRTDWGWADGKVKNNFSDDIDKKYYIVSVNPVLNIGTIPSNSTYTITSDGYINNAHKKITATITTSSDGPFSFATFSRNNMTVNSPQINGDIYSNGHITINSHTKDTVTGAAYCAENNYTIYSKPAVAKGFKVPDKQITLSVDSLMIPMPPMPNFTKTGTDIHKTWSKGEWSNATYPLTSGSYYFDAGGYGTYGMYQHSYGIDPGQSVTIYVDGNFDIGNKITGGNITIYATGNVTLNEGGIVQASPGGTVTIYANKILTLNRGSAIIGNTVTAYAMGDINLNTGTIQASSSGTVTIYTNNTLALNNESAIIGNTVTVLANNSAKSYNAISFNSGSINKTLPNSISKIYANGNVPLNNASVIAGQGIGMLVATGKISLNGGTAENTIFIANGNVDANNGSKVAGIYSNGTIDMNGATISYNGTLAQHLGIGSTANKFVVSWGK